MYHEIYFKEVKPYTKFHFTSNSVAYTARGVLQVVVVLPCPEPT